MSLLRRIENGNFKQSDVLHSITEQLYILFSNRVDVYWLYNTNSKKAFGIHEIFKLDKFSDKFLWELARGIEVWEPRIKRAVCSWKREEAESLILNVTCVLKENTQKIRNLFLPIKDI